MDKPYIGITGFMSSVEVSAMTNLIPTNSDRLLMIGVLVSQKTLQGIQNRWPNRYPKVEEVGSIFTDHRSALNLIHYNTKEKDTLLEQLRVLKVLGGRNFHGFQLNVAWPHPVVLEKYRYEFSESSKIVLQIGELAFEMVKRSPGLLSEKIAREYVGVVDYVLLDPSGGYGKLFDVDNARRCLSALSDTGLDIGLGVAGGLGPNTIDLIGSLAEDFPSLSIDAEGRLRNAEDKLDLELAGRYLIRALDMFAGY